MPLRKKTQRPLAFYLRPAASEADLGTDRPPQTIEHFASKGSFRLHRPLHYFASDMDLSRPKVAVSITFSVPGTQPPVFVASSLTNPAWVPQEMTVKNGRTPSGDLVFEKKFDAVEYGEYQYKFRLGPGDWWVCDESAPTVSDDAGNRNNLLHVKPTDSHTPNAASATGRATGGNNEPEHAQCGTQDATPVPAVVVEKVDDAPAHGDDFGVDATEGQQDAHAKRAADASPDQVIIASHAKAPKQISMLNLDPGPEFDQPSPLLPHEVFDDEAEEAPLLPHERSTSVSTEESDSEAAAGVASSDFIPVAIEGHCPLFRHESIFLSAPDSPPTSPSQARSKSHASLKDMMDEDDVNDPSIELFPTRRETILQHIQHLSESMHVDDSLPEDPATSPRRRKSRSSSSEMPPPPSPLVSIKEDEEELDDVQKRPSPDTPEHAVGRSIAAVPTPPLTPKSDDSATKLRCVDTPTTTVAERASKAAQDESRGTDNSEAAQHSLAAVALDGPATPNSSKPARITSDRQSSSLLFKLWNSLFGSWLGPIARWFSRMCGGQGRATILALAIGTAVVAYSYQSVLTGTQ